MERIIEEIECLVCDLKAKEEEYKKKIDELEKKLASSTEDYKILCEYCEKILQHKVKDIRKGMEMR